LKSELEIQDIEEIADKVIEKLNPIIGKDGDEDIIFDVDGFAQYLKVGKQWVYEKVHQGSIPYYKVGKYPRFRKSKIDEWLIKMEKGNGGKSKNTVRRLLEGSA
jgi:excisionase family DNA binding protein